jgi:hypothetical protein
MIMITLTYKISTLIVHWYGKGRQRCKRASADVVVICGGSGLGSASEASNALKSARPLLLLAVPPLWREFFL